MNSPIRDRDVAVRRGSTLVSKDSDLNKINYVVTVKRNIDVQFMSEFCSLFEPNELFNP